jgi:uncharacterized membrane protein
VASTTSSDRLVTFVDAIVAIAITLLVVPLVERVGDGAAEGLTPGEMLGENSDALIAAAISFVVIARLWKAHHAVFEHVELYTRRLGTLTIAWAATIAFLPLPTAMAAEFEPDRVSLAVYIGTMTLSSALLSATDLYVLRHPEIQVPDRPLSRSDARTGLVTTGLFVVALAGAMLVPALSYWWLFALALTGPVDRMARRR